MWSTSSPREGLASVSTVRLGLNSANRPPGHNYLPIAMQQGSGGSGPQYSPDGRWWWNGVQWLPVSAYRLPAPTTDSGATTAMVLGIVGLVACQLLGPVAMYLAHQSIRRIE